MFIIAVLQHPQVIRFSELNKIKSDSKIAGDSALDVNKIKNYITRLKTYINFTYILLL